MIGALTFCEPAFEPAFFADVFDPYVVPVPNSNHQVVGRPRVSTDPVREAPPAETLCAPPVTTTGESEVEKVLSPPKVVPLEFFATIRTW